MGSKATVAAAGSSMTWMSSTKAMVGLTTFLVKLIRACFRVLCRHVLTTRGPGIQVAAELGWRSRDGLNSSRRPCSSLVTDTSCDQPTLLRVTQAIVGRRASGFVLVVSVDLSARKPTQRSASGDFVTTALGSAGAFEIHDSTSEADRAADRAPARCGGLTANVAGRGPPSVYQMIRGRKP